MADQTAKVEKIKEIINKMELDDQVIALEEIKKQVSINHETEHLRTLNKSKDLQSVIDKLNPNNGILVQDAGLELNLDKYKEFSDKFK